jgi:PTS system nitrogen regulatory IIA component
VCYLATPIDFGAPDGQPVQCVIMLATPTISAHLQILARLASALTDGGFKAALSRRASLAELIGEADRIEADRTEAER